MAMLPALDAPEAERVYNDNERAGGALLLALAARGADERRAARERITARLVGGDLGGEDDFETITAYRAALAILGGAADVEQVRVWRRSGAARREMAWSALLAGGGREDFDLLLWNVHTPLDEIADLLVTTPVGEALGAAAGELPGVDPSAEEDLRLWQVRILQDSYAIHRSALRLGLVR
jgi:hypothetical protein